MTNLSVINTIPNALSSFYALAVDVVFSCFYCLFFSIVIFVFDFLDVFVCLFSLSRTETILAHNPATFIKQAWPITDLLHNRENLSLLRNQRWKSRKT